MFRLRMVLIALGVLHLFAPQAQGQATTSAIKVRGYAPGDWAARSADSVVRLLGNRRGDTTMVITLTPHTDGMRHRHCGVDRKCNEKADAILRTQRKDDLARALVAHGINLGQIVAGPGIDHDSIGPKFRGVDVFVNYRRLVTQQPTVAREPERAVATITQPDTALRREVKELKDSIRTIASRLAATPTTVNIPAPNAEREFSLGLGVMAMSVNDITVVTPINLSLRFKPQDSFAGVSAEGGVWPLPADNTCNRMSGYFGVGLDLEITSSLGASLGAFTARRFCVDGGPANAEKAHDEINGLKYGPVFRFRSKFLDGMEGYINPSVLWAFTHKKGANEVEWNKFGVGLRLGAQIPWR